MRRTPKPRLRCGQNQISWISFRRGAVRRDGAEKPSGEERVIQLGVPSLESLEVVHLAEQVTRKRFDVQHVPEETLRAHTIGDGSVQQSFAA